jgi:hypothetical protein
MEEKNENVVEETTQEQVEQKPVEETTKVDESKFKSAGDDSVVKVDLSKPPTPKENENKEDNADDSGVAAESENAEPTQEQEEVQPKAEAQEETVLEEVVEEEEIKEEVEEEKTVEVVEDIKEDKKEVPDNIKKLVDFMEETGGDLNDYVRLNQDYSKLDDRNLLYEYYKQTKPHLNNEEINFMLDDSFSYDEEEDTERDIKRKKLALKEQVASAKSHLDGQKSKYYEEIKAGSRLTNDQQKAMDFFNRYNKESEANQKVAKKNSDIFTQKTNQVFNDKFKGFEYNVGDKKYRFKVKNAEEVKKTQSDINNFTKKFLDKNSTLSDAHGYHKSLYTAMNADAVAKHFYEQGKADAMKDSVAKSKNVDMNPRQTHGEIKTGGVTFKVLNDNSSDFKFKIKNKNK